MRIALHLPDPGWLNPLRTDGDARLVQDLVDELGLQGHLVQIVTLLDPLAVAQGRLPIRSLIFELYRVWRRMRRFDPEAYVVYMSSPRRPDLFCWWQRPRCYLHMYPGPRRARKPVPRVWRRLFAWVHRHAVTRADTVVLYNHRADGRPPFGMNSDRVTVLPFGSRPPTHHRQKAEARKALGFRNDVCVVLCVSRLLSQNEGKSGKTEAVVDLVGLADLLPTETLIVVVGNGSGRVQVENTRLALQHPERVRIEGAIPPDQVSTYYAAADIFAFPCRDDRPWVVLVEAQMHGLPVLTMRTRASETLVVHEKSGLLADDLATFRENLRALIEDEQLRHVLALGARTHANNQLTTEQWVRRLAKLLDTPVHE